MSKAALAKKEQEDAVMVMDMFRLMRDGGYSTAAALKKAIREAFPDAPQEQLDKNLLALVRRLRN